MTRPRLLVAFLTLCTAQAFSGQSDATYKEFVKRAGSGDLSMDFREFRLACLNADKCDAHGESKDLISARRANQAKEYGKAIQSAEAMVKQGFVNIEAHVICAQAYAALNEPEKAKFHHDIAAGLIRSILATGDGKTKETAFEVIDTSEEYVILAVLGLPRFPVSQALIPGKDHSYDLLKVTDPGTGKEVSVYFRIDLFYPMKGL